MRRILKKNIYCENTNSFFTTILLKYIFNVAYITALNNLIEYILTNSGTRKYIPGD